MRTTLKRGIGRGAAVNGNGRAVLPPGSIEPMRRYRQPDPPRRSTRQVVAVVLGWILLGLVVVASGLAGGLYLYAHETLNAIAPHSKSVKESTKFLHTVASPSEPATSLIIGYDARAGVDSFGASGSRSDTIMLVRADPQQNTLSLFSFPRDLVVPIYCHDQTTPVTTDRINTAFTSCGPTGTLNTVEKLTGIDVNYLITIDFHGFKLLVNKLHGIYIDVDHRYINTRRRSGRLREDQPRAGLPEAERPAGARLRPVPPHRFRPLSRRAAAALRRVAEGPARDRRLDLRHPEAHRRTEGKRGESAAATARRARRASPTSSRMRGLRTSSRPDTCSG